MRIVVTATFLWSVWVLLPGCRGPVTETSESTTGVSGNSQAAVRPVNLNCPIMGGQVTPEGGTVTWNGQIIGFCCEECSEKWAALSDEEKAAALADAGSGPEDNGHEHGAGDGNEHDYHAT